MKKVDFRPLLLACITMVFLCVLLSGASRLVGHTAAERPCSPPSAAQKAYLCSAPATVQETDGQSGRSLLPESPWARSNPPQPCRLNGMPAAVRDANGNVLLSQTYLRAVYQAFALGDGFA
ncbi:MAG TPA: hypothetical protein IAC19_00035 [Candidatus Ventricola gallistercoris]|nr:hypothetical protein [Candidatus Ventricola gallistercoris]